MCQTKTLKTSLVQFNRDITEISENHETSKCVKRLLSSLQSVSKKLSTDSKYAAISLDAAFSEDVLKCLTKLESIVLHENSFAETSVLSALAMAFLLNMFLGDTQKAIHLFFRLSQKRSAVSILKDFKVDNHLSDVLDSSLAVNDLTKVSVLSALLSCNYFVDYIIKSETQIFTKMHRHLIQLCSHQLIHQFHVFKLIHYWFRALSTYLNDLVQRAPNLLSDRTILSATLDQIDANWEHPINGVKDCIRTVYTLILESFSAFRAKLVASEADLSALLNYDLIAEELNKTSRLSFTCKAKYRKYSALIQLTGWQSLVDNDPHLCSQMLKYLSINSLSTSIIELYKSIVISMKKSDSSILLKVWSNHFLAEICEALKSKNKVIHNNLMAHLLPSTLTIVDDSAQLIFDLIGDSHIAGVALVKTAVDLNLGKRFSPPFSWFIRILVDSEDIVREEGLSLLINDRYITEKTKVYEIFLLFLKSNLNIDNPSFRQKIVSKIEKFVSKICISLNDKYLIYGTHDKSDTEAIEFLKSFCRITSSNLLSGASYQKKVTSLTLFDMFVNVLSKHGFSFANFLDLNEIYFLLMLSIVDKDDKVRKMSTNLLIKFHKTFDNRINAVFDINTVFEMSILFLNSPRHQESHCGGLIMNYIFHCFTPFTVSDTKISDRLQLIQYLISSTEQQLASAKSDLLSSAKHNPIHGMTLALNNCLSDELMDQFSADMRLTACVSRSVELCFECIDLMLSQLSKSSPDSSPSFQQMSESLEAVLSEQSSEPIDLDDISVSNDFQLLLSLCWLNIKECSFLLANWVQLSHRMNHQIIANSTLHRIGSQLITILSKCRHKGVIEATCIALTKFTASLIKTKTCKHQKIDILSRLLSDSLNCLTQSTLNSSITRRSAGIALTIQAILTGESEAFAQGFKLDSCLFNQAIDRLIQTANTSLPKIIDLKSDLPQTNAMHILRSIVSTASLSRLTVNAVQHLLPICIEGFSSDIWQIRNASLQLFGSCCCRMLGQRKTTDVDSLLTEGSTITYMELFSRYPTLLSEFKSHFGRCMARLESGYFCPELVPILSLFASFSPIGYGEAFSDTAIIEYLVRLLSNRIWKVRLLSAKALTSFLPVTQLQPFLLHLSLKQDLNCNSIHGLMLSVHYLLVLKQQNKDIDCQTTKERFESLHQNLIDSNPNCYILKDVFQEIYGQKSLEIEFCGLEIEEKSPQRLWDNDLPKFLSEMHRKVEFDQSDDIRLSAANTLNHRFLSILKHLDSDDFHSVFELIEIVLVILEDEDRTVRTQAEEIASKLINNLNDTSFGSLNFNVAIDSLLMSCAQNPRISGQRLVDYLIEKVSSFSSVELLNQLFDTRLDSSEVLFEKEEKNVFSQPVFYISTVAQCLHRVLERNVVQIEAVWWKRLAEECRMCLAKSYQLRIKSLVCLSIWKLPKLWVALNSVFVRAELVLQIANKLKPNDQSMIEFEDLTTISETYNLLLNNFGFLSFIRRNSLSGYLLINYETNN